MSRGARTRAGGTLRFRTGGQAAGGTLGSAVGHPGAGYTPSADAGGAEAGVAGNGRGEQMVQILVGDALPFELWQPLSRWFHILPASFAVGTSLFLYFVLQPAGTALPDDAHQQLKAGVRQRLAMWVHISITLLLLTGFVNFFLTSIPQLKQYGQAMPYHALFGIKMLLALFVFFSQSLLVGKSDLAKRWQANARRWVGVNVLALVTIVALSGVMGLFRQGYVKERAVAAPSAPTAPTAPLPAEPTTR